MFVLLIICVSNEQPSGLPDTHLWPVRGFEHTYLMIPQQNENSIFFFLNDVVNCAQMVKCSKQLDIIKLSKQHFSCDSILAYFVGTLCVGNFPTFVRGRTE